MSDLLPVNSSKQKPSIKAQKSSPVKPFIVPGIISLLIVIWKVVYHTYGILDPLPWMEKWGEAMLILGRFMVPASIDSLHHPFFKGEQVGESGTSFIDFSGIARYSNNSPENRNPELLVIHANHMFPLYYLVE
jgi:hypothetical protein